MTDSDNEPQSFHQTRFEVPAGASEILLVRHGASAPLVVGEEFPLVDGQGDPALAPVGHQQAEAVGERLARENIAAVYVSNMQRTHQTAAPLLRRLSIEPRVDPDLREVHLGDWEGGLLRKHAAAGHPTYMAMREQQRWDVIPGAEPADTFIGRTTGAISRIAEAHVDELAVVVCHGGVIGAICSYATGSRPFAFGGADNGSISQIVIHDGVWMVRRFNDTSHLYDTISNARAR